MTHKFTFKKIYAEEIKPYYEMTVVILVDYYDSGFLKLRYSMKEGYFKSNFDYKTYLFNQIKKMALENNYKSIKDAELESIELTYA
jgi:hypothetical protein